MWLCGECGCAASVASVDGVAMEKVWQCRRVSTRVSFSLGWARHSRQRFSSLRHRSSCYICPAPHGPFWDKRVFRLPVARPTDRRNSNLTGAGSGEAGEARPDAGIRIHLTCNGTVAISRKDYLRKKVRSTVRIRTKYRKAFGPDGKKVRTAWKRRDEPDENCLRRRLPPP